MNVFGFIPTRGDRPVLLERAFFQMSRQTYPINIVCVNDPPKSTAKDLTWRFKEGISRCLEQGADLIFVIEDDDWYSPHYVQSMIQAWNIAEQPEIFGVGYSIYYHIGISAWARMDHIDRASAFCTMITKEGSSKLQFGPDDEIFADIKMWRSPLKAKTFSPEIPIAIGIKGGSVFGGAGIGHNPAWMGYNWRDPEQIQLRKFISDDIDFYKSINQ